MSERRPIKIDLTDGPCPHCAAWAAAKECLDGGRRAHACDDCGAAIPEYPNMGGHGYESQTVHHYHLGDISTKTAWLPVMRELCRECYLIDYAAQFPGASLPDLR